MTATVHAPPPGPPGRGTGWTVATDARAIDATAVTGVTGWRRPRSQDLARRSFADEQAARDVAERLASAGYSGFVGTPSTGRTGFTGVSVRADVLHAADAALELLDAPRVIEVPLAPGVSRNGAVAAFLRALTTQVSTVEER